MPKRQDNSPHDEMLHLDRVSAAYSIRGAVRAGTSVVAISGDVLFHSERWIKIATGKDDTWFNMAHIVNLTVVHED